MKKVGQPLLAFAFLGLTACANLPPVAPQIFPPAPNVPSAGPGRLDQNLKASYTNYEVRQRARGLLRTDRVASDARYDSRTLARNFADIALFEEYQQTPRGLIRAKTQSVLKRWAVPVRIGMTYDTTIPPTQTTQLTNSTRAIASQISAATGHPISLGSRPNLHILVLSESARRNSAGLLQRIAPELSGNDIALLQNLQPTDQCVVLAFQDPTRPFTYSKAIVLIRAELSPFLRRTCLNEEMAQALGLPNDSPRARPSVFNDDDEFAFLTNHDFDLLRLLYNPRLQPGMGLPQAMPIVDQILGNGAVIATVLPQFQ